MAASGRDDDSFFNFDGLPTELQVMILCRVTLETLCACAQTCSRLHQLCEDEEVWSSLARRDFGTRLPPPDADFSPRIFFREMLYRNLDGYEIIFLTITCETILYKYNIKVCIFLNKFRIVSPNFINKKQCLSM
jgi:hypothetical protein